MYVNGARRIDVLANVSGRDLGSAVADVEVEVAKVDFPLEYRAELLGEFEERQAAQRQLGIYAVIAAAAIFFLLLTSFGSPRLALLSFLTLPAALVGGLIGSYIGGGVISVFLKRRSGSSGKSPTMNPVCATPQNPAGSNALRWKPMVRGSRD